VPKVVDHAERRAQIITSATNLIADQGFDQLTIRSLAESINISTGMITHYFSNKDEILLAALQDIHSRFFQRLQTAIGNKQGIDAVRKRLRASLPLNDSIRKDWSIMFQFWGRSTHNKAFLSYMAKQHEAMVSLDIHHLDIAQKNGDIAGDRNLRRVFEQLHSMITGMGIACMLNRSTFSRTKAYAIVDDTLKQLASS
jgi:AcrR family transcriptional regulator